MARVNTHKLEISDKIFCAWQDLLVLLSQASSVPFAIINRLNLSKIQVYCTNNAPNSPYNIGDEFVLGSQHFCETTLKNNAINVVKDTQKEQQHAPQSIETPQLREKTL